MKNTKVWFVTGASQGLGLALVKQLLKSGYKVAATSRSKERLVKAVANTSANFLPMKVNLLDENRIAGAISSTVKTFGKIDVIVNNAGYGLGGSLEEISDTEIRDQFDINVFAMTNVIRQVMPYLRKQNSGHIFNISSLSGFVGDAGFGSYNASKFAITGLTEALAAEVKAFGIDVTLVAPGFFRTNFLSETSVKIHEKIIDDYSFIHDVMDYLQNVKNGTQEGDPDKAALAMIKVAQSENPPLHLFLGPDAYERVSSYIEDIKTSLETWKEITLSTDFD